MPIRKNLSHKENLHTLLKLVLVLGFAPLGQHHRAAARHQRAVDKALDLPGVALGQLGNQAAEKFALTLQKLILPI